MKGDSKHCVLDSLQLNSICIPISEQKKDTIISGFGGNEKMVKIEEH